MDTETLIQRAKDGERLTKDQRQKALRNLLEENGRHSSGELAETFNVTERTIYKDRREIRQDLTTKMLGDYGLPGHLWTRYRQTINELNKLQDRVDEPGELRKVVKDKWKTTSDFYSKVLDAKTLQRIRELERKMEQINQ